MNDIFRLLDLIASPAFVRAVVTMSAFCTIMYLVLVGRVSTETLFAILAGAGVAAIIGERGVESG